MGDIPASDVDAARRDPKTTDTPEREVTVLVTGFGPFLATHPINPSWEIARRLPPTLSLPASPSSPSTHITIAAPSPPNPLRVSYHPTATALPSLLSSLRPDLVLHIGLAAGRDFFAVERGASRTAGGGYARNADVDARRWSVAESDEAWPPATYPERLETGLGFAGVWEGWRGGCCGEGGVEGVVAGEGGGGTVEGGKEGGRRVVAIRPFDSVGSYLCGFSYYTSLAWFWAREREGEREGEVERPVLFLHVPACPEEVDVVQGREITEELIKAMVACWVAQKERLEKAREIEAEAAETAA